MSYPAHSTIGRVCYFGTVAI